MKHTTFDIIPSSLARSFIGFDELFNRAMNMQNSSNNEGYPPYNIEKCGDNNYVITIALAGFNEDDIEIKSQRGILEITGSAPKTDADKVYLHKGIAQRAFTRKFSLEENVEVEGADLTNGLLSIKLLRVVPEEQKPKMIQINRV